MILSGFFVMLISIYIYDLAVKTAKRLNMCYIKNSSTKLVNPEKTFSFSRSVSAEVR